MQLAKYSAIVAQWEKDYGVTRGRLTTYNPAAVRASFEKFGKIRQHMHRHHKANDFFFALWMPHIYAKRYVEFRPDDTARLCDKCHRNIERYSKRLKEKLYQEFDHAWVEDEVDESWCEAWRAQFRSLFDKWIARAPRQRKRTRKRRRT